MSGQSIPLGNGSKIHSYIVWVPPTLSAEKLDIDQEDMAYACSGSIIECELADLELVCSDEIFQDVELWLSVVNIKDRIKTGKFQEVIFCGKMTSEFARHTAYLACYHGLNIKNTTDSGGTLDRYIKMLISGHARLRNIRDTQ